MIEWRREKLGQKEKEKLPKNELWQHPNETKMSSNKHQQYGKYMRHYS